MEDQLVASFNHLDLEQSQKICRYKINESSIIHFLKDIPPFIIDWFFDQYIVDLLCIEYTPPDLTVSEIMFLKKKIKEIICLMITQKTPSVPNNALGVDIENYLNYGDLWLNYEAIQILKYGFSKEILFQRNIFVENLILKLKTHCECSHFFPQINLHEDYNFDTVDNSTYHDSEEYDADIDLEQEYNDHLMHE